MEYKDELRLRLIQAGIEPTEDIIRFIDLETIPLKAKLFEQNTLIADRVETAIDSFLSTIKIVHSHLDNQLMYGYCSNGSYEMQSIDIKELSEHIIEQLKEQ